MNTVIQRKVLSHRWKIMPFPPSSLLSVWPASYHTVTAQVQNLPDLSFLTLLLCECISGSIYDIAIQFPSPHLLTQLPLPQATINWLQNVLVPCSISHTNYPVCSGTINSQVFCLPQRFMIPPHFQVLRSSVV